MDFGEAIHWESQCWSVTSFSNSLLYSYNAYHAPTLYLIISSSCSPRWTLSFIAALNQRRQVNSQRPVVTVIGSHTWRVIVMTASSCLLGLDILLRTFDLELLDLLCLMFRGICSGSPVYKEAFNTRGNAKWYRSISVTFFFLNETKRGQD